MQVDCVLFIRGTTRAQINVAVTFGTAKSGEPAVGIVLDPENQQSIALRGVYCYYYYFIHSIHFIGSRNKFQLARNTRETFAVCGLSQKTCASHSAQVWHKQELLSKPAQRRLFARLGTTDGQFSAGGMCNVRA